MTTINENESGNNRLFTLGISSLGVVFGDIGTSPLYALRECFNGAHAIAATEANIMGVLSLIFWALIIVISLKYMLLVMRADNHGEGGIIALLAFLNPWRLEKNLIRRTAFIVLGLFGAALLYGDGTITPAISVLSAIEGLSVSTSVFDPYIIPITLTILVILFLVQYRGTAKISAIFGPVMLVWFSVLALLGIMQIVQNPLVLQAISPVYALEFFINNGLAGFVILGTVFLVVTGGEALYADMGHFGLKPIRLSWFTLVLPALLLNYYGQGALILANPAEITQPFFHLAPQWAQLPLVLLSTLATIIASQAVITGVFSLTNQAVQLKLLPRMQIIHTSSEEAGQVYVPAVNWLLMLATLGLVIGFQSSSNLSSAYGIAVSTDMVITTILIFFVILNRWHWRPIAAYTIIPVLLIVDLAFFGANSLKIASGGWYPIATAIGIFILMSTWQRGRLLLAERLKENSKPIEVLLEIIKDKSVTRVPGTAIFLTRTRNNTPPMLHHHLTHNQVLHEQVILLTIKTADEPRVPAAKRLEIEAISEGLYRIIVNYGFMQQPNISTAIRLAGKQGLDVDPETVTYYIGRETLIPTIDLPGMMLWREHLFAFMSRNSARTSDFYGIPPDRVVELGIQVEI